jgi:hypothetical protein
VKWLKHAFAVEPTGPAEPTPAQHEVVAQVCRAIVARRMTTPALMFLEVTRPMNYLGAQAMHFLAPIASVVTDAEGYRQFAAFLERRGSVDYLCRQLEAAEAESEPVDQPPPREQAHEPDRP